jgi:hypothetical protein
MPKLIHHHAEVPLGSLDIERLVTLGLARPCTHYECRDTLNHHLLPGVGLAEVDAALAAPEV